MTDSGFGGMMCPRGGSKGGKHPNKATQEHPTWHTVCPRFGRKATQWERNPLGLFYCLNGANLKAKKKEDRELPSWENKDIIDLLRGQRVTRSNQTDILQAKFAPAIPDG